MIWLRQYETQRRNLFLIRRTRRRDIDDLRCLSLGFSDEKNNGLCCVCVIRWDRIRYFCRYAIIVASQLLAYTDGRKRQNLIAGYS